jgi:lipopolysaccharide transport system ATP-binding protein
VGDGYFQKKCSDRIQAFRERGRTLLFCSHALYYVAAYCDKTLWMRDGKVEAAGDTREVVQQYETYLLRREAGLDRAGRESGSIAAEAARGESRLVRVAFAGGEPRESARAYAPRAPWAIEIEWVTDDPERRFHLHVGIDLESGLTVAAFSSRHDGSGPYSGARRYRARIEIASLPLVKGIYKAIVFLGDEEALHVYDRRWLDEAFAITGNDYSLGLLHVEHRWQVEPVRAEGA